MAEIKVSNIKVTDLSPKVVNPEAKKLLPTIVHPYNLTFEIAGVDNSVANAIRRTLVDEFPVKAMTATQTDFESTDPYHISEMILARIKMIPIMQNVPEDAIFILDVENKTPVLRNVLSSEIKIKSGAAAKHTYFNETFVLFTLNPGKTTKIKEIKIMKSPGFVPGNGMMAIASNVISLTRDQVPFNPYEPEKGGTFSRVADSKKWQISFNAAGTVPDYKKLMTQCVDLLIEKIKNVKNLLYLIEGNDSEFYLEINGESDTLGNLFMRTIDRLYPNLALVKYSVNSVVRILTIKVVGGEDINDVYGTAISHLINIFTKIRKFFE